MLVWWDYIIYILLGGWPTPLKKYVQNSWDDEIPNNQYMEKSKTCSKPPTSIYYNVHIEIILIDHLWWDYQLYSFSIMGPLW